MVSSSKNVEGKEVLNFQLVSNKVKKPNFKAIHDIAYKQDPSGALSMIPPNILMVQDVRKCYNYKIGSIGDMEIKDAYKKKIGNDVLKEGFKMIGKKGLIRALDFPNVFKTEWIRIVLS